MQKQANPVKLNFHFDPLCPLAWRTALWIREARKVRPIDVQWRFFSLEMVNRKEGVTPDFQKDLSWPALRTLAYLRDHEGNEAVERLYVALGNAAHGQKLDIKDVAVIQEVAQKAGFDGSIVEKALSDNSTKEAIITDHEEARSRYAAFGVPTIAIEGSNLGYYGPVIQEVPQGEDAGEFWDYTAYALRQPNIFELKRDRSQGSWGPVSAVK